MVKVFNRNSKLAKKYVKSLLIQKRPYQILTIISWIILISFTFISIEYILHLEVMGMTFKEACDNYFPKGLILYGIWALAVIIKNILFMQKYIPSIEKIILDYNKEILIYNTENNSINIKFDELESLIYTQNEHKITINSKNKTIETYDYFENIREIFLFFSLDLELIVKAI